MKRIPLVLIACVALTLSACSAPASPPEVETITPKPTQTETTEATPEAEAGSREAPLPPGEQRKLTDSSMWSVGAEGPTQVGAGYIVLPLHIGMDWDAARAQGMQEGDGTDPWTALLIEYVSAGGRSYDQAETYVDVPNQIHEVGTVYAPLAEVSTNYVVTLPDADVAGGVWKVSNSNGDSVFIATGLD